MQTYVQCRTQNNSQAIETIQMSSEGHIGNWKSSEETGRHHAHQNKSVGEHVPNELNSPHQRETRNILKSINKNKTSKQTKGIKESKKEKHIDLGHWAAE